MSCALFTAGELAAATGGCWRNGRMPDASQMMVLNTDSRALAPGQCFVPLVGERFDGHDFLDAALKNGAATALIQTNRPAPDDLPCLEVADTLLAYQALANFHRRRMSGLKVVGVTGSVGKTSVKEMLRAIFTEAVGADAVLYTVGNTNNQIGVPQNLLRLTPQHRFAVIEMGTNHHGEIAPLTAMAQPDAALINTIAACHLEFLGDLNGVAKEKSTIFQGLQDHNCMAVYPAQCAGLEIIKAAAANYKNASFSAVPGVKATVTGRCLNGNLSQSTIELNFQSLSKTIEFNWNLTGAHQAGNAAAAAALALHFGLSPELIAQGLSHTTLPGKRMNMVEFNGATWINDAYNANPESMQSALFNLHQALPAQPLLVILGDMLELGAEEINYHRQILELVKAKFDRGDFQLWLVGKRFAEALKSMDKFENWRHFENIPQLEKALQSLDKKGLTIYLKSSNSIGLSKVEPC